MGPLLTDLLEHLRLERLEDNLFRGDSRDVGSNRVFGGQVLGQALNAAAYTVESRVVHSLHAYFLRAGDIHAPIIYDVDRARDGRSFTNRRVVAIQHGRPIFNLAASFQIEETGLEHQHPMPDLPGPESLKDLTAYSREFEGEIPDNLRRLFAHQRPFEFRPVQKPIFFETEKRPPRQQVWFRAVEKLPEDDQLHRCLLAYVSDYHLLITALLPHGIPFPAGSIQTASLDHAMWFHRSMRVDEWLLYDIYSPSASGARGFARGYVFTRDGQLVASDAQEGLIRQR